MEKSVGFINYIRTNLFWIVPLLSIVFIAIVSFSRRYSQGTWGPEDEPIKAPSAEKRRSKYHPEEDGRADPTESRGEQRARRFLEGYFGAPFTKVRPSFLSNPITNGRLELDCYNEELGLAVEYNGRQHYEFVPYFHENRDTFLNQKYRDHIKKQLCEENGILLIEIPYTVEERLEDFLYEKLVYYGF